MPRRIVNEPCYGKTGDINSYVEVCKDILSESRKCNYLTKLWPPLIIIFKREFKIRIQKT